MRADATEMAIFVRVVEAGSIAAAARSLRVSPSAVSKRLMQLENRLAARLLQRTTRRLSLTEVGEDYYRRCLQILADIREAEAMASGRQRSPTGTLRVSCATIVADGLLIPMLPEFMERYRDLRVDLALSDRLTDVVEEGFDLALRIGQTPNSSLIGKVMARGHRVLCAAPAYVRSHGLPESPDELSRHKCLVLASADTTLNRWPFRGGDHPIGMQVAGHFTASTGAALYRAALAGLGIARVTTVVAAKDFREDRLVRVLPDFDAADEAPLCALYPSRRHVAAKLRVFLDFLTERLRKVSVEAP
ncbi:MAG: LysR family transcriptional regulator [Methyloligellaceae bacterium]